MAAGADEDFADISAQTGEPFISSMAPPVDHPHDDDSLIPVVLSSDKPPVTAYELWQIQKRKREIREEFLASWNKTTERTGTGRPMDAIISPCMPFVAHEHGQNRYEWVVPLESC